MFIHKINGTRLSNIYVYFDRAMDDLIRNTTEVTINLDALRHFLSLDELNMEVHPAFCVYQDSCKEQTISAQLREFAGEYMPIS